jgi:hypothetical protein
MLDLRVVMMTIYPQSLTYTNEPSSSKCFSFLKTNEKLFFVAITLPPPFGNFWNGSDYFFRIFRNGSDFILSIFWNGSDRFNGSGNKRNPTHRILLYDEIFTLPSCIVPK